MCSGDLHINKDAVSQPVDEKLITGGGESIYSNENVSYNNISDKLIGKIGSDIKEIQPSLPKGSKPKGNYANTNGKRGLIKQNETANLMAKMGFDIEMLDEVLKGNGYGINLNANPDFIIEGKVFDCYAPDKHTSIKTIIREISSKTKKQTPNIILNLDDYEDSLNDLINLIKRKANPKGDLKRLRICEIIRNGKIYEVNFLKGD